MTKTFDPYALSADAVTSAEGEVLMTNPTAPQELEAYWSKLPRRNGIPSRKDVDPSQMSHLLEDCFILERVAPGVARIRVAGQGLRKLFGIEPRGLPLTAAFLPKSRMTIGNHVEAAFAGPSIVQLDLIAPRAIGQPRLDGQILLLPMRDDLDRVTRLLGCLVMSGRRGIGGRRFEVAETSTPRVEPVQALRGVPRMGERPSLMTAAKPSSTKKTQGKPALRLVVSNP